MKLLKLKLITLIFFGFLLGSCEKEVLTEEINQSGITDKASGKYDKCVTKSMVNLGYRVIFKNTEGRKKSFDIKGDDLYLDKEFGILDIFFNPPKKFRNSNFFKAGITEYIVLSRKPLQHKLDVQEAYFILKPGQEFEESVRFRLKTFQKGQRLRIVRKVPKKDRKIFEFISLFTSKCSLRGFI